MLIWYRRQTVPATTGLTPTTSEHELTQLAHYILAHYSAAAAVESGVVFYMALAVYLLLSGRVPPELPAAADTVGKVILLLAPSL